jgi:hypothetical protein
VGGDEGRGIGEVEVKWSREWKEMAVGDESAGKMISRAGGGVGVCGEVAG